MAESIRSIRQIIPTEDVQMGPLTIGQPLPTNKVRQISPFLLLHHLGPLPVNPGHNPMDIGAHPHRGFAPVTFVYQGEVAHKDSLGNERLVKAGGVQWMSAGSGIVHAEAAGEDFVARGGKFEIIQLWINLPSRLKMSPPTYYPFDFEELAGYDSPEITLKVACGSVLDFQGPVQHPTPITAAMILMTAGAELVIPTDPEQNTLLYQLGGSSNVNDNLVEGRNLIDFSPQGIDVAINCQQDCRLLLVSGAPINEPLAQYGPFVMNKPEELNQAIEDYQLGKMGVL